MTINNKHSFKDYLNQKLTELNESEFSDSTITGSCFAQEVISDTPQRIEVFPSGTHDVQFEYCNLINVALPANSNIGECCSCHQELSSDQGITIVEGSE